MIYIYIYIYTKDWPLVTAKHITIKIFEFFFFLNGSAITPNFAQCNIPEVNINISRCLKKPNTQPSTMLGHTIMNNCKAKINGSDEKDYTPTQFHVMTKTPISVI